MKKGWIALIVVGVILLFVLLWGVGTRNSFVTKTEEVNQRWSQVENVYQRRMDLIPNLVETVKGSASFEKSTLEGVINARARATQITVNPTSAQDLQKFQAAQGEISQALSRLMVVVEKYPDLKSTTAFRDLQSQLEGTENRIAVERREFNKAAQEYNRSIQMFPEFLIANWMGLEKRGYFQADEGAAKPPKVKF